MGEKNEPVKEEKSAAEERIRALTKMYYANPAIQNAIVTFSQNREVVPRYFEGFGKRPDTIQYPSDIKGLVLKGATSFHSSEEIWTDPLKINSDMSQDEMNELRRGWDLLIDIDSPFLDCSKIAAKLIISALEHHGIKNYGLKFSGKKGFHILIGWAAFPESHDGKKTKDMFPEWPRAISEYLMNYIRADYNKQASEILTNFEAIKQRTNLSKEDLMQIYCTLSNRPAKIGILTMFRCPICKSEVERRDVKSTKRRYRCPNNDCAGELEVFDEKEYYYCEYLKDPDNEKLPLSSINHPEYFEKVKGVSAEKIAALDLVLVAPRHLFRMPYSLHEKTALASVVLTKEELENFSPRDANAMHVKIKNYLPENLPGEGKRLLTSALEWKKNHSKQSEEIDKKKYANYETLELKDVKEEDFPDSIKKLLLGLKDGKKRGLFILITFLKTLNFPADYINSRVREWNKLNSPPLKEGYVKGQIDWHLRQKKKILPPNYDNEGFYKDLGLIDKKMDVKNPIVEVTRKVRKRS